MPQAEPCVFCGSSNHTTEAHENLEKAYLLDLEDPSSCVIRKAVVSARSRNGVLIGAERCPTAVVVSEGQLLLDISAYTDFPADDVESVHVTLL